MSLPTYREIVSNKIRDVSGDLTNDQIDSFIKEAVYLFSSDFPKIVCSGITASADVSEYSLPSNYIDGFSIIERVEYPVEDDAINYLDSRYWGIVQVPGDRVLRFVNGYSVTDGEEIRLLYSTYWSITTGDTDIAPVDKDAVCNLAAALCCESLANRYAQTINPTIEAAIAVDYDQRPAIYRIRSQMYRELYSKHIKNRTRSSAPFVIAPITPEVETDNDF